MQAQAYEGYFENGQFYTAGRTIRIPERRRVYITILDEPANNKPDTWAELDKIVVEMDEKPRFEDFPRTKLGRELINFEEV